MGVIIREAESGTLALIFIVRLHRILQASGLPHNGHGSVTEAHELA